MNHTINVKFKFLRETEKQGNTLEYATEHSAGLDLRAFMESSEVNLEPGQRFPFPTGVCMEISTPGIAGFVYSRSGLGTRHGLVVSQGVGVIDPDYRGEIIVSLLNNSPVPGTVKRGERIAQLLFLPFFQARIIQTDELSATRRGSGGFGHTGTL
ncbi:dUTP diphosphatase [Desulfonatronovibrio hydrogenovorans]|uniref:dUTP diphosphatase n=1 Tax=Desulfonatronovibrio hydrogenovorans TaxID=53245 RepID=UPI0004918468|nr:dUTP diphosphatase [Desulfonatronovibrio hydrogenovorans]